MPFDHHDKDKARLFSLSPGRPFFDDLAALLVERAGNVADLPRIHVFVPSRRSVRTLKTAFRHAAGERTLLLPRITAVADLEENGGLDLGFQRMGPPLPPAASSSIRKLKLAQIYRDAHDDDRPSWSAALRAADALCRTADTLTEYGVGTDELEALLQDAAFVDHAAHWKDVVRTLRMVTELWPAWTRREGLMDGRRRRAILLEDVAGQLADLPETDHIIAAGFLGTSPSSRTFLKRIAHLEHGCVVFPGLDHGMPEAEWAEIEPPHPQSAYRILLEETFDGATRSDVASLDRETSRNEESRRALLSLALMPTESTHRWYDRFVAFEKSDPDRACLEGLQLAIAQDTDEEADFIALELRALIEEPGKTGVLVTADRNLARRVAAKLRSWDVEIDDSGGAPLGGSFRATFLRLVARLMVEPSNAVNLAALVHHQLFGLGLDAKERRPLLARFDQFLRGRTPREGWDGLLLSLEDDWRPCQRQWGKAEREQIAAALRDFIIRLREAFTHDLPSGRGIGERIRALMSIAERLAATPREAGAARLYRFEDGEAVQAHLQTLLQAERLLPEVDDEEWPHFFDAILQGQTLRQPGGQHPRLAILGVLEARLQTADLVVVGGLAEGIWPAEEAVDPFLSHGIRRILGLPSPDMDVGRLAHDFASFATSPRVLLTRAERNASSPQRASRFMIRLESILANLDRCRGFDASPRLRAWRGERHGTRVTPTPAPRPAPTVPRHLKPRKVSVSSLRTWMRDPYAIYARNILKLRRLEGYGKVFGGGERGQLLHALFEDFVRDRIEAGHVDHDELTGDRLDEMIARYDVPYAAAELNRAGLEKSIGHFVAFDQGAVERGHCAGVEIQGEIALPVGEESVTLTARIDRIDREDGGYHIVDYKSGGGDNLGLDQNFTPQLYVAAMIAEEGKLGNLPQETCARVTFLRLGKEMKVWDAGPRNKDTMAGDTLRTTTCEVKEKITEWLSCQFEDEAVFVSQIDPDPSYPGDYDDLARVREWRVGDGS